jgi:2-dehydro-3-deoxyphosphogluconate aldolase/(4S)-4-hydroxy-2-oxoglutarate aldolase
MMKLASGTIISILRGIQSTHVCSIVEALLEEGIDWVEVSLSNEEEGLACIEQLAKHLGEQIHLGVGTVIRPEQVNRAMDAGAKYIITPGWDRELVRYVRSQKIEILPGVFSPGEVMQAQAEGIETVKLFPAGNLGGSYIKSLRGPFPQLDFLAVGGVNLDNLNELFEAGCSSFAIGSELVPRGATQKNQKVIREKAHLFQETVTKVGELSE